LARIEFGISSHGGCLWSTDKDYTKQITCLAHAVNSVSGLALDFGHRLALDFIYFNIQLVTLVNFMYTCADRQLFVLPCITSSARQTKN
jgi:hypothetical protein